MVVLVCVRGADDDAVRVAVGGVAGAAVMG